MSNAMVLTSSTELDQYMAEVNKHKVLNREQETALAMRYYEQGDIQAAHELVVSNLRFVVKVAHEYKGYGLKLLDLVQEGNVGLMVAVKKFDPTKGYRLISYAVWWIRAYIKSYIARSWSLVRMGSTRAQKKLFFKLRSKRNELERLAAPGEKVSNEELAAAMDVDVREVEHMEQRLALRDFQLDHTLGDDTQTTYRDMLSYEDMESPEEMVAEHESNELIHETVEKVLEGLSEREQFIVHKRLLTDDPMTLQELGDSFGVTRERARQIEAKVMKKLKVAFSREPGLMAMIAA